MKKYLFVGLILLLILISACHTKTPETGTTNTQTTGEAGINDDSQTAEGQTNEEVAAIITDAENKADNTLCTQLESLEARQYCLQRVIKQKAIIYKSEELCASLTDKNMKSECLDSVYLLKARDEKSASYCPKINDQNIKVLCEQYTR